MSETVATLSRTIERFVVEARLLGLEQTMSRRKKKEREFALEVTLSDESKYTVYRTTKDIVKFHSKLVRAFPIEAGHFNQSEKVIPDCPVSRTPFGIKRVIKNERTFEKLLNFYVKELPALPASIIKSGFIDAFFRLRESDFQLPEDRQAKKELNSNTSKTDLRHIGDISQPMTLTTYVAVADYVSPDEVTPVFSFKKGSLLQVIKKDQSGWWMVDSQGMTGWAPASFLFPLDEEDSRKEWEDNQQLISFERVGSRYIAVKTYEAAQDDELSLVPGAVVRLIKMQVNGWWLVHYNGQKGFVPGSFLRRFNNRQATIYVKKIKRGYISRKSTRVPPTMRPKWMKSQEDLSEPEGDKKVALYQCIRQFSASPASTEMNLYEGDIVKLLSKDSSGWWYVEDERRRTGWVPASHLLVIVHQSQMQRCLSEDLDHLTSLIGSLHIATRPHDAQEDDELSIDEGDLVTVIETSEDGWWFVRAEADGKEGLVPSLCLSPDTNEDSNNQIPLPRAHSTADIIDRRVSNGSTCETGVGECHYHTVNRDYQKQAPDELSVFEGEIARIIDNTHGDTCYVNVNGHEGWLPVDLLSPLNKHAGTQMLNSWSSCSLSGVAENDDNDDVVEDTPAISPPIPPRPPFLSSASAYSLPHLPSWKLRRFKSYGSNSSSSSASTWGLDGDENTSSFGSILLESHSLEELEKAATEAERLALELRKKAKTLRGSL